MHERRQWRRISVLIPNSYLMQNILCMTLQKTGVEAEQAMVARSQRHFTKNGYMWTHDYGCSKLAAEWTTSFRFVAGKQTVQWASTEWVT